MFPETSHEIFSYWSCFISFCKPKKVEVLFYTFWQHGMTSSKDDLACNDNLMLSWVWST